MRLSVLDQSPVSAGGAPEQVTARLGEIARAYGVDELVIVTICHAFAARLRSYELLAEAFGITQRTEPGESQ